QMQRMRDNEPGDGVVLREVRRGISGYVAVTTPFLSAVLPAPPIATSAGRRCSCESDLSGPLDRGLVRRERMLQRRHPRSPRRGPASAPCGATSAVLCCARFGCAPAASLFSRI